MQCILVISKWKIKCQLIAIDYVFAPGAKAPPPPPTPRKATRIKLSWIYVLSHDDLLLSIQEEDSFIPEITENNDIEELMPASSDTHSISTTVPDNSTIVPTSATSVHCSVSATFTSHGEIAEQNEIEGIMDTSDLID